MDKRALIEERVLLRPFELVLVIFIFASVIYFSYGVIHGQEIKQTYTLIDFGLESSIISSSPGIMEVSYKKDLNFTYTLENGKIIVRYGPHDKFFPYLHNKPLEIINKGDILVLKKNE